MFDLTGKAALVTGATGGIGAAIARALHAQGARVALTGRRAAELEALVAELGDRALAAPADLADPAAPAALVERVEAGFGALDILVNNAGQANYAAAKAGLVGMSKSLAQEVATRGITVNVVAPGFVKTAMTDALGDAQRAKLLERIPTARMGTPEDIAAAVAYLSSAEAGWITGQTLHVNGGMAMV